MADPESLTAAAAVAIVVSRITKGLGRVIGPSADEVGEALRRWTAYRVGNVERVEKNAEAKLGDAELDKPGSAPIRLAMHILDEGSYSDDEIVVEYLGGVLASSRTPDGGDDRGVSWTALVARMSKFELRTHYIFYTALYRCFRGRTMTIKDLMGTRVLMPIDVYWEAMDFSPEQVWPPLFQHSLYTLARDGLIDDTWFAYGPEPEDLSTILPNAPHGGIVFRPSRAGVELYHWGLGRGQVPIDRFLGPELDVTLVDCDIVVPEGTRAYGVDEVPEASPEPPDSEGPDVAGLS